MDRQGSGLRRLTVLLLVLNLGVLVAGWGGAVWRSQGTPLVTFNAEKIQLLADVLPESGGGEEESLEAVGGQAQVPGECPAWPALDADGVAQVQAHLRQAGVADADYDLQVEMRLGWWVYVPPLESPAALQVVMDDARAKGVVEMAPVRSGSMTNALALGTFATLDGARKHAQDMVKKGLRGVRYAPRPGAGAVRLVAVRDSPRLRQVLAADWPAGLAPNACQPE